MTLTDEALQLAAELDAPAEVADLLCRRGDRAFAFGRIDEARADYERAAKLARRSGAAEAVAASNVGLAMLARHDGDLVTARALLDVALANCPTDGFGPAATRTAILVELARVADASGDLCRRGGTGTGAVSTRRCRRRTPTWPPNRCTAWPDWRCAGVRPRPRRRCSAPPRRWTTASARSRPAVADLTAAVARAAGDAYGDAYARGRAMDRDALLTFVAGR